MWLLKCWGEYFVVVVILIFLLLEVYDLVKGIMMIWVVIFSINVVVVVYLLIFKWLFGGCKVYDVEWCGE